MVNAKLNTKNLDTKALNIIEPQSWKTAPVILSHTLLLCLFYFFFVNNYS